MSDNKERRCKICGKLLLDEKIPICRRCQLKSRNIARDTVGSVSGLVVAVVFANRLTDNNSSNDKI